MEPGHVDLHLHLLPGLDDGPTHPDEALEMVRAMAELGYTHLCATPHRRQGYWSPEPEEIEQARLELAARLAGVGLSVELSAGAENHVDDLLLDRLEQGILPTLGSSRTLLLELPDTDLGGNLDRLLFELLTRRFVPVIAHPERFDYLFRDRQRVPRLRERGARLQVSLTSLAGRLGRGSALRATALLEQGQVDLVASDVHGLQEVEQLLPQALTRLERLVGPTRARQLTCAAPLRLAAPPPLRATPASQVES